MRAGLERRRVLALAAGLHTGGGCAWRSGKVCHLRYRRCSGPWSAILRYKKADLKSAIGRKRGAWQGLVAVVGVVRAMDGGCVRGVERWKGRVALRAEK